MAMPPSSPSCAFARPRVCRDLLATRAVLSGSEPAPHRVAAEVEDRQRRRRRHCLRDGADTRRADAVIPQHEAAQPAVLGEPFAQCRRAVITQLIVAQVERRQGLVATQQRASTCTRGDRWDGAQGARTAMQRAVGAWRGAARTTALRTSRAFRRAAGSQARSSSGALRQARETSSARCPGRGGEAAGGRSGRGHAQARARTSTRARGARGETTGCCPRGRGRAATATRRRRRRAGRPFGPIALKPTSRRKIDCGTSAALRGRRRPRHRCRCPRG